MIHIRNRHRIKRKNKNNKMVGQKKYKLIFTYLNQSQSPIARKLRRVVNEQKWIKLRKRERWLMSLKSKEMTVMNIDEKA